MGLYAVWGPSDGWELDSPWSAQCTPNVLGSPHCGMAFSSSGRDQRLVPEQAPSINQIIGLFSEDEFFFNF